MSSKKTLRKMTNTELLKLLDKMHKNLIKKNAVLRSKLTLLRDAK